MAIPTTPHTHPATNTDPSEAERDTNQLTPEGTPGSDAGIYEDMETAQSAGSRNERVTEFHGTRHNTEPFTSAGTSDKPKAAPGATGITNLPIKDEMAEQERLDTHRGEATEGGSAQNDAAQNDEQQTPEDIVADLMGTKEEKGEKAEISDMRPVR